MSTLRARALAIAEKTSDAYSFDRYTSWTELCKLLLAKGYTEQQVEAMVYSKWTRWAADCSNSKGYEVTAKAALPYIVQWAEETIRGKRQVEALTQEHFGTI